MIYKIFENTRNVKPKGTVTNDLESKNAMVGHEEKEHLVPLGAVFWYTSSYPKPDSTDCLIQIQELTKERLWVVSKLRLLFLAQI